MVTEPIYLSHLAFNAARLARMPGLQLAA